MENEEIKAPETPAVPHGFVRFDTFCQFCGKQNGYIDVPEEKVPEGGEVTSDDLGVADVRCSECEADKGSYKDMEMEFYSETGGTYDDFKAMHAQAEGDVKKFRPLVKEKREKIEREHQERIAAEKAAKDAEKAAKEPSA